MTMLPGLDETPRKRELSQFYTPPWLAFRCWQWAFRGDSPRRPSILEPSAGQGALLDPIFRLGIQFKELDAIDIDPDNCAFLRTRLSPYENANVICSNFLEETGIGHYNVSVFNPPYEDGKDVAFCEKVCGCTDNAIAILRTVFLNGVRRGEFFRHHDIRRMAILEKRPDFGGDFGAKADFIVLDLRRRKHARKQGEACTSNIEWWSP